MVVEDCLEVWRFVCLKVERLRCTDLLRRVFTLGMPCLSRCSRCVVPAPDKSRVSVGRCLSHIHLPSKTAPSSSSGPHSMVML